VEVAEVAEALGEEIAVVVVVGEEVTVGAEDEAVVVGELGDEAVKHVAIAHPRLPNYFVLGTLAQSSDDDAHGSVAQTHAAPARYTQDTMRNRAS
jgi:phosphopentomutase